MSRLYLRLFFHRIEKTIFFFNNLKTFFSNFSKPIIRKQKLNKVLKINRDKLTKKQDIINSERSLFLLNTGNKLNREK